MCFKIQLSVKIKRLVVSVFPWLILAYGDIYMETTNMETSF